MGIIEGGASQSLGDVDDDDDEYNNVHASRDGRAGSGTRPLGSVALRRAKARAARRAAATKHR